MKINLAFFLAIIFATGIVAVFFTSIQITEERNRLIGELTERSSRLSAEFEKMVSQNRDAKEIPEFRNKAASLCTRYRIIGIAYLEHYDSLVYASRAVMVLPDLSFGDIRRSLVPDSATGRYYEVKGFYLYRYVRAIRGEKDSRNALVVFTDAAYLHNIIINLWFHNIVHWLIEAFFVFVITILILRYGIFTPLNKLVQLMKSARIGKMDQVKQTLSFGFLKPLHTEATRLAEAITEARAAAEEEATLRTHGEAVWTPERLNVEAMHILKNKRLIVVSNREPYMHIHDGREIKCIIPASGMVTAMEPILMACGGLWVASGSGDADKEVVDDHDKIRVPPDEPKYTLRRIWISKEEEEHYYYGFSNEGLWPLCHVAHTRPTFRTDDWVVYQQVNRKFADAILDEIRSEETPFILVQDYHFALLPAMIKESRPDARVSIFWHIPWPNPESFGICPWQKEILTGMLGADLIGFHTQYHCNNFLSTVNRAMESRIAWENFSVTMGDHTTRVNPFPISIAFTLKDQSNGHVNGLKLPDVLKEFGTEAQFLGVGVDRIDYTKGILERFLAIDRFLEKYPSYQGKFTFVQIGAPSRTFLKSYSDLIDQVGNESERINKKYEFSGWKPIILLDRHHSHKEIEPFYQLASLCMVTSLHDGMNLVAKEFIASRNNRSGVLILSRFTGAAQDLVGPLIVNPYDIEEMADTIKSAIEMPKEEQRFRMDQMRESVLKNNVYSWAANLLKNMNLVL